MPFFGETFDDRSQADRDAITIENQRVLIAQLKERLKSATNRISDLEFALGVEKRVLLDENQRLKASLRDANRQLNQALGLPWPDRV